MTNTNLEFNYSQSRTITRKLHYNDTEGNDVIKTHFLFILLKDLPQDIPLVPNPRKPDINSKPCKQMLETLEDEPEYFTDCNRGLLLIAKKVHFPAVNDQDKRVIIDFGQDEEGNSEGGLVDGGHTYEVLKKVIKDESLKDLPIFVTVIEGADEFATKLARARNTSVQVDEKSISNQNKEFDPIKEALGSLSRKIIFYQNQDIGDDEAVFPIEELIALMTALNRELYSETNQPTVTYTGLNSCFKKWSNKKNRSSYEKIYHLLPSIVRLYEYLYKNFEDYAKNSGTKIFGRIKGVEKYRGKGENKKALEIKLPFTGEIVDYRLAKGFIMPIFASLRFLLEEREGELDWAVAPEDFLEKHGSKLVGQILEAHTKEYGSNPNRTGKSAVLWQNIANAVIINSLQEKLAKK